MDPQTTKKEGRELQRKSERFNSGLKVIGWLLFGAAILGGLVWLIISRPQKEVVDTSPLLTISSDDYSKGNSAAPVTLIEYLDFECEACGAYYPLLKKLAEEFPDDLRIVTRYFPLPGHRNGLPAALAVEAAAKQGKYWEMHDMLFESQKEWSEKQAANPALFEKYAVALGLDLETFKKDVEDPATFARVKRDMDSGQKLGNSGTPTFFLNGQKIENPQGYEPFKELVQSVIDASAPAAQ